MFLLSTLLHAQPDTIQTKSGYTLKKISAGRFVMGSSNSVSNRGKDETEHEVVISQDYYIGIHEVPQRIWDKYATHKSRFLGAELPVAGVTFFDALTFANTLSKEEGLEECYVITPQAASWPKGFACTGYRLPTEAEWEYAARANQGSLQEDQLDSYAWSKGNSGKTTHPVGSKKANAFGLYDTLGNVWEWVWDIHQDYPSTELRNPTGAKKGNFRIRRGGGYSTGSSRIRIADRYALNPINQHSFLGLRLAKSVP